MLRVRAHISAFPRLDRMRFVAQESVINLLEPLRRGRRQLGRSWQEDISITVAIIEAAYHAARKGPLTLKRNGGAIGDHLRAMQMKAAQEWQAHVEAGFPSASLEKRVSKALAELATTAGLHACQHCPHDHMCEGLILPGNARLTEPGQCLKSLCALATLAAQFTEKIYSRYVDALSSDVHVDVYFAGMSSGADRVTGKTEFAQPSSRFGLSEIGRPVWVELDLPVVHLEPDSYFSIIYVIAHEIAVHAVQELWGTALPTPPSRRVAFAEGLIDRVIFEELVEAIRHDKPMRSHVSVRAIPAIRAYHTTRRSQCEGTASFWPTDLDTGQDAYEFLVRVGAFVTRSLAADPPSNRLARVATQEGRIWAHSVALKLNVMPLSEQERQLLAETFAEHANFLDEYLPGTLSDPDTPFARLVTALNDIDAGEDQTGHSLLQVVRELS